MREQSWLNETLGADSLGAEMGQPDPTRPGETASIGSVVLGFLRNEGEFSADDVAQYINTALQNEAGDLWAVHEDGAAAVEEWQRQADRALTDNDLDAARVSWQKRDAMIRRTIDSYSFGRTDLGEALHLAQNSTVVPLTLETRDWATKLDQDHYLSRSMGVDVTSFFSAHCDVEPDVA